ncbi:MAG: hypothetical protein SFX18_18820 [Pirellulales bacterium]|nr:hypothetical protein [Pirellulales bacterium]
MSAPVRPVVDFAAIAANLRRYYLLWMVPTIIVTALAIVYAGVKSQKWKATQAAVLRDEGSDNPQQPLGRFASPDSLKAAQESIVQIAKNPAVVGAALKTLGPADGSVDPAYPGKAEIEETIAKITVSPPKGSEFGKTDMIYLATEARTSSRAEQLNSAVLAEIQSRLQTLRAERAKSLITEYTQSVAQAQKELTLATAKLEQLEIGVGADIGELRTIIDGAAGNSNLRESSNHIKERLRTERSKRDQNNQLLLLLGRAKADPNRLAEAPTRLFELNPALKRMKEGLVDAQIKTASLLGRMTPDHPEVTSARLIEQAVRLELTNELDTTMTGLETDLQVSGHEIDNLQDELNRVESRLQQLASMRAPYANLQAEVKQRNELLFKAQKGLSDAQASLAAAFNTSVLIPQDQPDAGTAPIGPTPTIIVLGGAAGGLLLGLGLVFITVPIGQAWGRRWSDHQGTGRRAADRMGANRNSGIVAQTAPLGSWPAPTTPPGDHQPLSDQVNSPGNSDATQAEVQQAF